MVAFIVYDLVFLVLFTLGVVMFLYTRKHNLQRQGILYLYRTKLGIVFIDKFAKRFGKILKPMQYLVLLSGYFLMIVVMWMIIWTTYLYWKFPILSQQISAPPVFPLIPYFPKLFGLESFFPPLYFAYFIIALAIVAVVHEFAHGIYARLYNFKIHATGFAFLGPFLGAFVEPDEKQMSKAKKFPQMVILAAGTFANVVATVVFGALMILFFTSFFVPAGVKFNTYALTPISVDSINIVGNSSVDGFVEIMAIGQGSLGELGYTQLSPEEVDNLEQRFYVRSEELELVDESEASILVAIDDSPAFTSQLRGVITEIDGEKITGYGKFVDVLGSYEPGDEVKIKTAVLEPGRGTVAETLDFDVELADNNGKAYLGVGFFPRGRGGVIGFAIENTYNKMKDPFIHYESEIGNFGWFIFYLLWWIVVINLLVALFNMLPLGILDGGRFFYLTIWGITGKEDWGRKSYSYITWFLLLLLLSLMIKWVFRFF